MASFYYNEGSGENYKSQWNRYLQNQAFVGELSRDTNLAVSRQTEDIREAIAQASEEQAALIRQSTQLIVGSIETLDQHVRDGFAKISSDLNKIQNLLGWGMSLIIDQLKISNILNKNIALLLRIPEIQKERRYYIEQGLKFFQNARYDQDLYQDAIEFLTKAYEIDKTDYFVLHRLGLIYLYGNGFVDIEKAEEYFRKAAKYAIVETHSDSAQLFDILAGDINLDLSAQGLSKSKVSIISAESYFQASIACYVQGKFREAAELSEKAFQLEPRFFEAGFTQAKALCACGEEEKALPILKKVILWNRYYAIKLTSDIDLASNPAVLNMLQQLTESAVNRAQKEIKDLEARLSPDRSAIWLVLNKIKSTVSPGTYISALAALDELHKIYEWNYQEPFIKSRAGGKIYVETGAADFRDIPERSLSLVGRKIKYGENTILEITKSHMKEVFSKGGEMIALNEFWDIEIYFIFCLATGNELKNLCNIGYSGDFISCCFHPDGKSILVSSAKELFTYDIIHGKRINTVKIKNSKILDISNNGLYFILEVAQCLSIWDINKLERVQSLPGPSQGLKFACFSPDDNCIAISASKLFIINRHKLEPIFQNSITPEKIVFSPTGSHILCLMGNVAYLIDIATNVIMLVENGVIDIGCGLNFYMFTYERSGQNAGYVTTHNLDISLEDTFIRCTIDEFITEENDLSNTLQSVKRYLAGTNYRKLEMTSVERIYNLALAEEQKQDNKKMFRSYALAESLYAQASYWGYRKATEKYNLIRTKR